MSTPEFDSAKNADDISFPHANMVAVRAIAGILGSTIGPMSLDKLVVSQLESRSEPNPSRPPINEYVATNDGATLLDSLPLEHPVAPIVRRIVGPERPGTTGVEGKDIPDGVSSTVVLAASLLDEAEELIEMGIHPAAIQRGYCEALHLTLNEIDELARPLESFADVGATKQAIASTSMTGNEIGGFKEEWSKLAVEAVDAVGLPNEETFAVRQIKAGSISDSKLIQGAVLDRNAVARETMPKRVEDARVMVIGGYRRNKASDGRTGGLLDPVVQRDGERIQIESLSDIDAFDDVFAARRGEVIAAIDDAGVNIVVTRLGISSEYLELLADRDIMGIRGVNRLKLAQVAKATGATTVLDPMDVEPADLGRAGIVEERTIGPRQNSRKQRRIIVFDECPNPTSVAVFLTGVFDQIAEQSTTEIRKGAMAVAAADGHGGHRPGALPGAGATETLVAKAVRNAASREASRAQLAMRAFADAVERLIFAIGKNAGADPLTVVADLRSAGTRSSPAGFVLPEGTVRDAFDAGVVDPLSIRHGCYVAAVEVANLILRIDDAIDATFEKEPVDPDDTIYDDRAEKRMDHLENQENEN